MICRNKHHVIGLKLFVLDFLLNNIGLLLFFLLEVESTEAMEKECEIQ